MDLAGGKLRLDHPAEHVARLTIDNPAKRNALDHEILDAFAATVPELDARCLLVTATGPVFSAGYDIGNLPREEFADRAEALVAHPFHEAIAALDAYPFRRSPRSTGTRSGAGSSWRSRATCAWPPRTPSWRCRLPGSASSTPHTGLRKFVDAIGARARASCSSPAQRERAHALQWGLVYEVDGDDLAERVVAYAAGIAANAPLSLSGNKRALRELLAAEGELDPEVERGAWSRSVRPVSRARTSSRASAPSPRSAHRAGRVANHTFVKNPFKSWLYPPMR